MKVVPMAMIAALAGALLPGRAHGQDATDTSYDNYYASAADPADRSPSDRPTPVASDDAAAPKADGASSSCGCNSCGNDCCDTCCDDGCDDRWPCCKHGEAWKLFDLCPCSPWKINGWLDQGYTYNPDEPADRFNGPVVFNDRSNEYQMNQLYLYAEKATDTKGCGWDFGGRVDLLYGTDSRFTLAQGLDSQDDLTPRWGSGRFYGLAMPQLYAEVAYDDLKVKVGHFYTTIGYEVVNSTGNYFYSHCYTHQYGEPFTHTGVLATWAANERLSIHGGITRGWDNFEDLNDETSFLAGFTITSEDKDETLAYAVHNGDEANFFNGVDGNRYMQSLVYTKNLSEKLKWVVESDYGWQDGTAGAQNAEWYGLNQYLFRTINECWSWGVRAEWFRDDDGTRVAPVGDFRGSNTASVGGFAGDFYEVTLGLNWKPNANVIVRPELRYDVYDGPNNTAGNQPFDDGTEDNQFLAAFDVILTY